VATAVLVRLVLDAIRSLDELDDLGRGVGRRRGGAVLVELGGAARDGFAWCDRSAARGGACGGGEKKGGRDGQKED
jgi:hypothetical protein